MSENQRIQKQIDDLDKELRELGKWAARAQQELETQKAALTVCRHENEKLREEHRGEVKTLYQTLQDSKAATESIKGKIALFSSVFGAAVSAAVSFASSWFLKKQ